MYPYTKGSLLINSQLPGSVSASWLHRYIIMRIRNDFWTSGGYVRRSGFDRHCRDSIHRLFIIILNFRHNNTTMSNTKWSGWYWVLDRISYQLTTAVSFEIHSDSGQSGIIACKLFGPTEKRESPRFVYRNQFVRLQRTQYYHYQFLV